MIHLPLLTLSLLLFPFSLNAVKDPNKKILRPRTIKRAIKKEPCEKKTIKPNDDTKIIINWQGRSWRVLRGKKEASCLTLHDVNDPTIKIALRYSSRIKDKQDLLVNDAGHLALRNTNIYWENDGRRLFCDNEIKIEPNTEIDELASIFVPIINNDTDTDNSFRTPWFRSHGRYEYVNCDNFYDSKEALSELFPEHDWQRYLSLDQES